MNKEQLKEVVASVRPNLNSREALESEKLITEFKESFAMKSDRSGIAQSV
jgi:hypothetical protein